MNFKDMTSLENAVMLKIQNAMQKSLEEVYQIIDRFVKEYYVEYSPEEYVRTYQFYKSLVKTEVIRNGNSCSFEIYFDEDKLDYYTKLIQTNSTTYGAYTNKGYNLTAIMDNILNKGYHSPKKPRGTAVYVKSLKILDKQLFNILKRMFKESGLNVK